MDALKLLFVFTLTLICGCSKLEYIWTQGVGQVSLLNKAKPNEEVLKDVQVPESSKEKIREIEKFKTYFYQFFGKKPGRIYSKTTFLKNRAVSYLVLASPASKIESIEHCFPIVGCFPYLGFYDKSDAEDFSRELNEKYVTAIRPVYAYSSLTYFTDPILSSFFVYDHETLAEVIFHELFHALWYIKNETSLSENLANFFARHMADEYFVRTFEEKETRRKRKEKRSVLTQKVVSLVGELNKQYADLEKGKRKDYDQILNQFLSNRFKPEISRLCSELGIERCYPLNRTWNNASFAEYLTYEKSSKWLRKLFRQKRLSIKSFYEFLRKEYTKYIETDGDSFQKFLEGTESQGDRG